MQTDKLQEAIQDISKRLVSLDPVEHNSAVNIYYEPNASYQSSFLKVSGASRIKKVLYLRSVLARKSEYVGEADWDEANQILTLNTATQYGLPVALQPFDLTITVPGKVVLHLNADEDGEAEGDGNGEGRKLYVTKMDVVRPIDKLTDLPIVHFFHSHFVLPVLSLALLISAGTLAFWDQHPLKNGVLAFVVAAIHEIWTSIQGEVARQVAGRGWDTKISRSKDNAGMQLQSLKKKASSVLDRAATQAPDSMDESKEQATTGLESAKAKSAELVNEADAAIDEKAPQGVKDIKDAAKDQVPKSMDEAKGQASDAAETVKNRASEAVGRAEAAIDEKAPEGVKNAKDQAKEKAPGSIDEAKQQVSEVVETAKDKSPDSVDEAKQQASEIANAAKDNASSTANKAKLQASETAEVAKDKAAASAPDHDKSGPSSTGPHTPEAPSWAAVAANEDVETIPGKEPLELLDKGEAGDAHKPEPDHNSDEPGAISYAEAVQE